MTCQWEGGTLSPDNAAFNFSSPVIVSPNKTFNIAHNFSYGGFFTIVCNMSNFFSHQVLEHNVITLTSFRNYHIEPLSIKGHRVREDPRIRSLSQVLP